MASGTITLTRTGSGYLEGQIVWSSTSNGSAANTSTVTADLQIRRSALNTTTGTFKGTFTVGTTSETISWYGSLPSMEWITIKTTTVTIGHNADGNGSCYMYAIVNGPTQTSMEGTYVSGAYTVTLDWIPRHASIVSVSDFTDNASPVITYSNPAGEAVDSLQACISLDGQSVAVVYKDVPKTGTIYTFPLTEAERNTLRAATTNSNELQCYIFLRSTIGGSESYPSAKATMRIVDAHPTISPNVVDTNSATVALTGNSSVLVAFHSTASVTINASAKKYASIVSERVEHGTAVLNGNGTFSPVTNNPIRFIVTDSRGNWISQYASNTIIPYINPTCSIGNNMPEAGGAFSLVVTGLFYNGSFGAKTNSLKVQYRYKTAGNSYGKWTSFGSVSKSGNGYTATANLTDLDYQTVYTFQARVTDSIHTGGVNSAEKAVISEPVFDWGQNDFRFNVPVNLSDGCDILKDGAVAYAPDGYGLGNTHPKWVDSINDITKNGYYYMWLETSNGDPITGTASFHAVVDGTYNNVHLSGKLGTGYIHRDKWDGTWGPWQWVNPPMVAGVEYRTTKRWNGKPVYTQLLSAGSLPSSGSVHLNIPSAGTLDYIISAKGSAADQRVFPTSKIAGTMSIDIETHSGGVDVYVSHDWLGGSTFYVTVEYTLV